MNPRQSTGGVRLSAAMAALGLVLSAQFVQSRPAEAAKATEALRDEIVVKARKKSVEEDVQDAPLAITAYGDAQLEALQVRELDSLAFEMPNVALDDVGTARGVANFSIRGLGINSSIPSIDPTVGVFVDGVYLGINAGVVLDIFDLEAIEVLRGPQGVLFGRNVTGGAVLMRTKKPTETFEFNAKLAGDRRPSTTGGNNYYAMASASGPVVEDKVFFKLAGYMNNDNGWFYNRATRRKHGEAETYLLRPQLMITPMENVEIMLRYERGWSEGDGPSAQNRGIYDRDDFKFGIDEEGRYESDTHQFSAEVNVDVEFGNGTITNIFGWRDYSALAISDIDASEHFVFHAGAITDQDQFSNELRYAGRFADRYDVTVGFFYLTQDIIYQENRNLFGGASNLYGGGTIDHSTWGIFGASDITLIDDDNALILNLGLRFSHEKKKARIANLSFNPGPMGATPADIPMGACDVRNFSATCMDDPTLTQPSDDWNSVTPKIGLTYLINEDAQAYGFWTRGFRSGGYNLRSTATDPAFFPGPFDQERQDSFEIGVKSKALGFTRLNFSAFYNIISDMQREINLADPMAGVVQVIRNVGDARLIGFEAEYGFLLAEDLLFTGNVGYVHAKYTEVTFDLNSDGVVDGADEALKPPRVAPWTVGASLVHDYEIPAIGSFLTTRIAFYHRDESFFTDNNLGTINNANMLDLSMTLVTQEDRLRVTFYAQNLLNEAVNGGETILPASFPGGPTPASPAWQTGPGATFAPLNKGRFVGLELNYSLN